MRILITGSRTLLWSDRDFIRQAMLDVVAPAITDRIFHTGPVVDSLVIVHGACSRGADALADSIARQIGWRVERHPADWERFGKGAGFVRNSTMVALGADVCLAFIEGGSKGASMCVSMAYRAGIPVIRFTRLEASQPWHRGP